MMPRTLLDRVQRVLAEVLAAAERHRRLSGFCIGNTAKVDVNAPFFSPIRHTRQMIAGSAIVDRPQDAATIAGFADGQVDYILVDSEKKVGPAPEVYGPKDLGNIESAVRSVVRRSRVLTYKGNDLAADSIDCLLPQLIGDPDRGMGGRKAAIIGAGNLGAKLALKLVERGTSVVLTRRDAAKLQAIVDALNVIKPVRTVACVTGTTDNEKAAVGADILIGATAGTPVITATMIDAAAAGALITDAGKGSLAPEAIARAFERGLTVLRLDIRAGFEGQVAMLLEMERLLHGSTGRAELGGIRIVSGLLGREGEFVVDDVCRPTRIFGVADGRGDFIRHLSGRDLRRYEELRDLIEGASTVAERGVA